MNQQETAELFQNQILVPAKARLLAMPETTHKKETMPGKWSAIQIIGHLIDSATNNHDRFIKAQLSDDLVFEPYPQEALVNTNNYQAGNWEQVVEFWYWYNIHLCHVIRQISDDDWSKERHKHSMHQEGTPVSLSDLVLDYIGHLEHHLRQVLPDYVHKTNTAYA